MNDEWELTSKEYRKFEESIKYKNRFFIDPKFIESLKEVMKLNKSELKEGKKLYRARIHKSEDQKDFPFSCDKMFNPKPEEALRGRANPDGISYLYLSSDMTMCIKEVSPKFKDIITVGEFILKTDIEIISLVNWFSSSSNNYINSLNHRIRITFSKTQLSARPEIEYLPYQFICALIEDEHYAGVSYNSTYKNTLSVEDYNLVLFDSSLVTLDDSKCSLIQIKSTNYEYEKID